MRSSSSLSLRTSFAVLAAVGIAAVAGCAVSTGDEPPAQVSVLPQPSLTEAKAPGPNLGPWVTSLVRISTSPIATGSLTGIAPPTAAASLTGHKLEGIASFYWQDQMTANGERFDKAAMTAAHKTLPFNTRVRVTHLVTGRAVIVRINDRGPFKPGRVIDLSDAAAGAIGMREQGLAPVRIDVLR